MLSSDQSIKVVKAIGRPITQLRNPQFPHQDLLL
jgi:hypothetical protein